MAISQGLVSSFTFSPSNIIILVLFSTSLVPRFIHLLRVSLPTPNNVHIHPRRHCEPERLPNFGQVEGVNIEDVFERI
jgi:hypothetical protein